jgi:excisionase family DNA binding protein
MSHQQITLITVAETAKILNLPKQRVWGLIRTGALQPPVVVRFGRQIRIAEEKLRIWLEGGGSIKGGLEK